uniref:28S ribosomal protein S11, mitochondrial n=1 Tax=Lygus hesperus TaxID=30085 RepID=A0A0A9XW65_LYGHE
MSVLFKIGSSLVTSAARNAAGFLACSTNRALHASGACQSKDERRSILLTNQRRDEGTEGEGTVNVDSVIQLRSDMFPNERTPDMLFNGLPFSQVPICNIRVSKNNTILTITDPASGEARLIRSCGIEGFKNTRKGTNVAAQSTAITFGTNAINRGYTNIRVRVRGLGPGRMSAIKGLQMAGLNIISITDNTPVSWYPPRPRKARRL